MIVFDVNETLLDLGVLDVQFSRIFGDAAVKDAWFNQVLQSALVMTVMGEYTDFGSVARMALDMTALRHSVVLSDSDRKMITQTLLSLPPHPEVKRALEMLKNAGFHLAALTNSAQAAAETQLKNAGLISYFERILSVEAVRKFKPAPEVYAMAAAELGQRPDQLRMVAAHDWDVLGAMNAGWKAAFVARRGKVLAPQHPQPDIIGSSLYNVAEQIVHFAQIR